MKVDMQLDQDKFRQAWQRFAGENWKHEINVRDFIVSIHQDGVDGISSAGMG